MAKKQTSNSYGNSVFSQSGWWFSLLSGFKMTMKYYPNTSSSYATTMFSSCFVVEMDLNTPRIRCTVS